MYGLNLIHGEYTWKSPGGRTRNQIDYITIEDLEMQSTVKTHPGADGGTDDNPVVTTVKFKSKSPRRNCST